MSDSNIQWTDKTWNPTTGCTRVSPGCKNCYAFQLHDMRHAAHQAGKKVAPQYAKPFKELQLFEDRLTDPLHWRKPCRVFVNSMSDLFHKDVPDEFIDRVFAVMALCPQHTFQVLTKRPERMAAYMNDRDHQYLTETFGFADGPLSDLQKQAGWLWEVTRDADGFKDATLEYHGDLPLPNVWLGVSVENQAAADERIPLLLQTPAAVRFLSCEPLLGPVDLTKCWLSDKSGWWNSLTGKLTCRIKLDAGGEAWGETEEPLRRPLDWMIAGGESGPGARPCNVAWIRSLVEQCKAAGVAAFVKQLGAMPTYTTYEGKPSVPVERPWTHRDPLADRCTGPTRPITRAGFADKKGGDPEEWPADLRIREFPTLERSTV